MNYTENLSLGLPEYGESADVAALNRNSGILDAYVYNTRQMECEPYDSTKTYMSGDLAIHNEVVYECNTDNTTGTWDDSKWDSTTLAEQIAKAKQSGGGQVTKEATGNPVEITDAASAPLVKCVSAITGSQDLHGYDKPWVGGAGKNKLEVTVDGIKAANGGSSTWTGNSKTINSCTWTIETDTAGNVTGIRANTNGSALVNQSILYLDLFTGLSGDYLLSGGLTNSIYITIRLNAAWSGIYSYSKTQGTQVSFESTDSLQFVLAVNANQTINDVFLPMVRLAQGTDSSFEQWENKSPITAYNQNTISVRGKNLLDKNNVLQNIYIAPSTMKIANIGANGASAYCEIKGGITYTVSKMSSARFSVATTSDLPANGVSINDYVANYTATKITMSTNVNDNYLVVFFYLESADTGKTQQQILDTIMVEEGSVAHDYEPYVGTTHTTTFPSAIYRGSEDVVNGTVGANSDGEEWIKVTFDGSNDELWYLDGTRFYIDDSSLGAKPHSVAISNQYENHVVDYWSALQNGEFSIHPSAGNIISFVNTNISSVSDWRTYLASNNLEVAYQLQTPTTSQVTPTNLPIRTLSGYNHIESSTGDMEVEYITEGYQPLVDLIQSSNGHTYSTSEQVVGKWIDGKDLYERTFELDNPSQSGVISTGQTYDIAFLVSGYYVLNDGNSILSANQFLATSNFTYVHVEKDGDIQYRVNGYTATKLSVTIRYTKTTTTRSLSAPLTSQKAQIEPLTDKTDEVPTEEEKAVNEEENTNENR